MGGGGVILEKRFYCWKKWEMRSNREMKEVIRNLWKKEEFEIRINGKHFVHIAIRTMTFLNIRNIIFNCLACTYLNNLE